MELALMCGAIALAVIGGAFAMGMLIGVGIRGARWMLRRHG